MNSNCFSVKSGLLSHRLTGTLENEVSQGASNAGVRETARLNNVVSKANAFMRNQTVPFDFLYTYLRSVKRTPDLNRGRSRGEETFVRDYHQRF